MNNFLLALSIVLLFLAALLLAADEEPFDPRAFAAKITREDMGAEKYKKYLADAGLNYGFYIHDVPDSDVESYLNDRLADKANEVSDIPSLKKFVAWLALYSAWDIPLPPKAIKSFKARESELRELAKNFSWEKLLAMTEKGNK
jgi:hypothetical protein